MEYECIGICQPDESSGLCEGCGRPYFDESESTPEAMPVAPVFVMPIAMATTSAAGSDGAQTTTPHAADSGT